MKLTKEQASTINEALAILQSQMIGERFSINGPTAVKRFLQLKMASLKAESFCVMFLDTKLGVIAFEEMFKGTLNQCPVFTRDIAKAALLYDADAIVLVHNHPAGSIDPSPEDKRMTGKIREAMELLKIRVLDHVIVGSTTKMFSFSESGLID